MLKLDRLDLSGFKSFVDPVHVKFAGGITAIVGPNGCGKSNLSDGMSWVLGEQSAKSLRGGKMEDIIFNGSDQRRPLGMAEVTLTLKTDPSFERASEDGSITLGRRVFRTGESQYKLNGKTVRLKQIKELLMDTGLGIRAYSVIEQGKIGMILSGKPQERRKLLEEAAGITRYKARKRVAEVKLEEATANLLRLDDVISEIERSLRSLKRQAGAARRFKEQQGQYRLLLRQVLSGRWARLHQRLEALHAQLAEATGNDAELAAALHRDEASLAAGREALDKQSRQLANCHQQRSDLAAMIQGRQEFLKSSRQTLQEIAERAAGGRALAERRQKDQEDHRRHLDEQQERRQELLRERDQAAAAVEEDESQIAGAERDLNQGEVRARNVRGELLKAAAEVTALQKKLHQGQLEQERGNYRRQHLDDELEQLDGQLAQAVEALALAQDQLSDLERGIEQAASQLEQVGYSLEDTLDREAATTEKQRDLQDAITERRQRRKVLEQLSQAHAERRSKLERALAGAGIDEPVYLEDRVQAVEGWERALDFYLGELTSAVLLDTDEAVMTLARFLSGEAEATLLRPLTVDAETWESLGGPELQADPAVLLSLAQALELPPELAQALPPAFLVEQPADAERLARAHPGICFLSREGIWAQGGLLRIEGDSEMPGVLQRERELQQIEDELPKLADDLATTESELQRLVDERAQHAKRKNALEQELAKLRQDQAVQQARRQDQEGRHERLQKQRGVIQADADKLTSELETLSTRRAGTEAELRQMQERHGQLEAAVDRAQQELESAKEQRELLRTASAGRRGRLEVLQERLDSVDAEIRRLETAIEDAERQYQLWQQESGKLDHRRVDLERRRQEAEQELQQALESREQVDEQVILEQEKVDDLRTDLSTLEERIQACRHQREQLRDGLEKLRVTQASLNQDLEHLAVTYQDEFEEALPENPLGKGSTEPAEMSRSEVPAPEVPTSEELAQLEAELSRSKATLERLGPVNVLAVEEFEEQEERHGFLTTQRKDVADSVARLKETIREINAESSKRFRETFVEVNKCFAETFRRLFRGGEADMTLLDEEDVLESGIEITARPPGKRPQNIMLLSGGEKALTAIALLFALFQTKPSPFCILDEVDAPLDDPNTVRFVELLQEMCQDTQFLVITHNKITMEAASTLYGVTMEERGVSKLVSVEMDEVQPEPVILEATA